MEEVYDVPSFFLAAVISNDIQRVEDLIKSGHDVDENFEANNSIVTKFTALHVAAYQGNVPMVMLLLSHGANVTTKNACGWLPFHLALTEGYAEVIKHESSPIETPKRYPCARRSTVGDGHTEVIRLLIAAGPDLNTSFYVCKRLRWNVLQQAIVQENPKLVRLLLELGADPNQVTGNSTVMFTAMNWLNDKAMAYKIVKDLIAFGAAVEGVVVRSCDGDDLTPLSMSLSYGLINIFWLLLPLVKNVDENEWCVGVERIQGLNNTHANMMRKTNTTALIKAIEYCSYSIPDAVAAVGALLERGADPNLNSEAFTPLEAAIEHDNEEIIRLLVFAGADTSKVDKEYVDSYPDSTWSLVAKASDDYCQLQKILTRRTIRNTGIIYRALLEIAYRPGGHGYQKAKNRFEAAQRQRQRNKRIS